MPPTHASVDDTACGDTPSAPPTDALMAARAARKGMVGWVSLEAGEGVDDDEKGGGLCFFVRLTPFLVFDQTKVTGGVGWPVRALPKNTQIMVHISLLFSVYPPSSSRPATAAHRAASRPPSRTRASKWLASPAQHR